jgi:predicted ribosomally synthesized peptide with nif11-like leader
MSQAEVQRFAADLRSDAALRQEVDGIASDLLRTVVGIAQRRGYSFTLEEAQSAIAAKTGKSMSESELDRVTGGNLPPVLALKQTVKDVNSAMESLANKIASLF